MLPFFPFLVYMKILVFFANQQNINLGIKHSSYIVLQEIGSNKPDFLDVFHPVELRSNHHIHI
jgi:hypothetical protein